MVWLRTVLRPEGRIKLLVSGALAKTESNEIILELLARELQPAAACIVEQESLLKAVDVTGWFRRHFGLCLLVLVWLYADARAGAQATLVADAHVSSARPDVNAGTLTNLNVGGGYTALVKFDLSMLPAGTTSAQITRAVLRVYCNRADTPGLVSLQPVSGVWGEYGVTYSTTPSLGAAVQTAQVSAADTFVAFDVTATVQAWVSGAAANNGLALTAGTAVVQFDSKENDQTGHAAELQIVLAAGGAGSVGSAGAQGPKGDKGDKGDAGVQGPVGLAGLMGAQGLAGTAGVAGASASVKVGSVTTLAPGTAATVVNTGTASAVVLNFGIPQGAGGGGGTAVGLTYQGVYSSTTNYAYGDVATFAGTSYASLASSNHGNTPGLSPAYWGVLAAEGPAGPQGAPGPQGFAGQNGAAGIQGPVGPAGPTGAAGPTGLRGTPGLVYRGTYQSTTNYAMGDVVVFAGSSWASLQDVNHGNTPGFLPDYWGILTAQGPQGLQGARGDAGPQGVQGSPGSVGPPGERGDKGEQGPAGQAGAQGIPGVQGAEGLSGPMGPQGVAGPVGMTFRGTYQSTANYALADGVIYGGTGYVSLVAANHGNTPDQSPAQWAAFATGTTGQPGLPGNVGPAGAQGTAGSPGPQGPAGERGDTGARGYGLTPRGTYSSVTGYVIGDVVSYLGSGYVSLVDNNHGQTPDQSPEYWSMVASKGDAGLPGAAGATGAVGPAGATGAVGAMGSAGPQGAKGEPGLQGPAGAQGLTGVAGPRGDRGDAGAQGVAGQSGAQGIPGVVGERGLQGPAGPQGVAGPVGLAMRGAYESAANYGVGDGVSYGGSGYVSLVASNHGNTPDQSPSYWALFAAVGAAGPVGGVGPEGAQGVPGSVGLQGLAGVQGPAGATGPRGQGLSPMGSYSSVNSYAVGDVVEYAGSGYVSLVASNHGQTPDQSPGYWALLASKGDIGAAGVAGAAGAPGPQGLPGATGPVGAAGAQGAAGPQGLQGAVGAQGLAGPAGVRGDKGDAGAQGVAGQAGAQGIAGLTGPVGPQGSTGALGPVGAVGLTFRGTYDSAVNYGLGDGVMWQGAGYVSVVAGNRGNTPDQSPSVWSLFAAQGGVGPAGAKGDAGPQGVAGAAGAVGSQGPAGLQGLIGLTGAKGDKGDTGSQGPAGFTGAQGLRGDTGSVGAQGAVGQAGPTGMQGPTGETGPMGAAGRGLTPQGTYSSVNGYGVGDVVSYLGSGYVSLVANNHGQTPDQSPAYWSVVASKGDAGVAGVAGATGPVGPPGVTGPAGAAGLAGSAGPKGDPGLQGPAGMQGVTGSTGATGPQGTVGSAGPAGSIGPAGPAGPQGQGLTVQGDYSSVASYAVGDVVGYGGAGYVSLVASNHGQTPDQSPAFWALLVAKGDAGAPGAAGAVGAVGPAGLTGPAGAQGAAGLQGEKGEPGVQGPAGAQGLTGAAGVRGDAGAVGAQGAAGQAGAQGLTGAAGPGGPAGPQGSQGLQGAAGPAGPTGAVGAQGQGLTPQGDYSAARVYVAGDVVGYGGAGYVSLTGGNQGQTPDQSPAYWSLLVARGPTGALGATGAMGAQGPVGLTGAAGTNGASGAKGDRGDAGVQGPVGSQGVTGAAGVKGDRGDAGAQGPAGAAGAQGATGTAGAAGAQGAQGLQGPQGVAGPSGSTGAVGAVGVNFRGAWVQGTRYAARDAVTFAGSTYLAESATTNDEPDVSPQVWAVLAQAGGAGPTGAAGAAGNAATVMVGAVTTLAAGATATVTNTGTASAAVLDFGIPQGAMGTGGGTGTGSGGTAGGSFAAVYHAVSFQTAFYSVNQPTAASNESAAVLSWVPKGCSAVRLDVFSQQSNAITVTLRNGTPGSMTDTALRCSVSSGTSCSATGSVSVAAGSFLDLSISGPSGTPAGVWTAVECD